MDPGVKKQRRRSVRNLRRSACFVPPSVNYGSAWIAENQDTNISNLVRSLEDLQCQDDESHDGSYKGPRTKTDDGSTLVRERFYWDNDEQACDGFTFAKPQANATATDVSYNATQRSCNAVPLPTSEIISGHTEMSVFPAVSSSSFSRAKKSGKVGLHGGRFGSTDNRLGDPLSSIHEHGSCDFLDVTLSGIQDISSEKDRLRSSSDMIAPPVEFRDDLTPSDQLESPISRHNVIAHSTVCSDKHNIQQSANMNGGDVSFSDQMNESVQVIVGLSETLAKDQSVGLSETLAMEDVQDNHPVPQNVYEYNDGANSSRVDGSHRRVCDEAEGGVGFDNSCEINSSVSVDEHEGSSRDDSGSVHKSFNGSNSMSPDFGDVRSYPNSAESTPSHDGKINQAFTSFFDSSLHFNTSFFSPTGERPNTPSSSIPSQPVVSDTHNHSGQGMSSGERHVSISSVTPALCRPVLSSDSDVSHAFLHHDKIASNVDSNPPTLSSVVIQQGSNSSTNTDEINNTTFTVASASLSPICENAEDAPLPPDCCINSSSGGWSYSTTTGSEKDIGGEPEEPMMIVDFDFKRPKSTKRRSSQFFPRDKSIVYDTDSHSHCHSSLSANAAVSGHAEIAPGFEFDGNGRRQRESWTMVSGEIEDNESPAKKKSPSRDYNTTIDTVEEGAGTSLTTRPGATTVNIDYDNDSGVIFTNSYHDIINEDDNIIHCSNVLDNDMQDSVPPTTSLSDSSNLNLNKRQAQSKEKKTRRKSSQLLRLIEESERILSQSNSHHHHQEDGFHSTVGDKENELFGELLSENGGPVVSRLPPRSSCTSGPSSRSLRTRKGRKSWDFRMESQASKAETPKPTDSDVDTDIMMPVVCDLEESSMPIEAEDLRLQAVYGKQTFEAKSPRSLETIKENATNEKTAFLKKSIKRYLQFGVPTDTKEKKRMKKALNVYRGQQCYFPVTDLEFERKMLDVQLLLDT